MKRKQREYHGLTGSPTYRSWLCMIHRCYNPKMGNFKDYGGKGVRICEFLRTTPVNLIALIGQRPTGKTLDRISSRHGYSCGQCADCLMMNWPMNVRWSTTKEQARNKTSNRQITIKGETRCMSEWAERAGIPKDRLHKRIDYYKWPESRWLEPLQKRRSH